MAKATDLELRYDDANCLDEVVAHGAYVHLERMAEHWFCLIVDDGKRVVRVNIGTLQRYRRRVKATVYDDSPSEVRPADSAEPAP